MESIWIKSQDGRVIGKVTGVYAKSNKPNTIYGILGTEHMELGRYSFEDIDKVFSMIEFHMQKTPSRIFNMPKNQEK